MIAALVYRITDALNGSVHIDKGWRQTLNEHDGANYLEIADIENWIERN